jgi:hypothetical protein
VRLVLLGSCRGEGDRARVDMLRRLAAEQGVEVSPTTRNLMVASSVLLTLVIDAHPHRRVQ